MSSVIRTGILGGTFDPIHCGHLDLAESARQALRLDTVLLVPSRVSPHRAVSPRVSGYHRFAMAALATADDEGVLMCDAELRSPDPSYTSITLEQLTLAGHKPWQLFFITGADAFADIASWHDYPGILDRSHFVVVARPGYPVKDLGVQLPNLAARMRAPIAIVDSDSDSDHGPQPTAIWLVDASTANVSSSELRSRLAKGESISSQAPTAVATYIRRHRLYT
jgi:nicotinate-nucleotide adenylyltransferase